MLGECSSKRGGTGTHPDILVDKESLKLRCSNRSLVSVSCGRPQPLSNHVTSLLPWQDLAFLLPHTHTGVDQTENEDVVWDWASGRGRLGLDSVCPSA